MHTSARAHTRTPVHAHAQWTVGADVSFFAKIVRNIGNTILIIRGQGSPAENLRVMYRSW